MSQLCSQCGSIVKKDLGTRVHSCPFCGFTADRDGIAGHRPRCTGTVVLQLFHK